MIDPPEGDIFLYIKGLGKSYCFEIEKSRVKG
jgi:hypothetical protein